MIPTRRTEGASEMFSLCAVYDRWSGDRIIGMKAPLELGLERLRANLADAIGALVCIVTTFDYDGRAEAISAITGLTADAELEKIAGAMLDEAIEDVRRSLPGLAASALEPTPRPINVLPATGSVLPGRFPREVTGRHLANPSLYESAYVRVCMVEADASASVFDALLGCDGIVNPLISYLAETGGWMLFCAK